MSKNNVRDLLDARRGGISLAIVGAPGTGKSTFLGSIGKLYKKEEILLLAPKPREINSWKYTEHEIDQSAEVFADHKWKPSLDKYEADAFLKLEQRVESLYDDTQHRVIILDPYTDVVKFAAHDLLKAEKAATPRDSGDSRGFYGALKHKLGNFTSTLAGLSSPSLAVPKHVLVAVHAQPAKEDEKGAGGGVTFEGEVMPMIEGGHRHDFASEFDILCYSKIKHFSQFNPKTKKTEREVKYLVQVSADPKRHAKTAIGPRMDEVEVENDFEGFLKALFLKQIS